MKRLPKNTEEISYYRNKKKEVVTSLVYPCGCTVDITWEDIEMGKTKNVEIDYLCDEHDATKPFKSLKTFLN